MGLTPGTIEPSELHNICLSTLITIPTRNLAVTQTRWSDKTSQPLAPTASNLPGSSMAIGRLWRPAVTYTVTDLWLLK